MFLGEYEYKVDSKGRLPIPPKFRQELGAGLMLTRGTDTCVIVYPLAEWRSLADTEPAGTVVLSQKKRKLNRHIYGGAFDMTLDGQGRVALPLPLRRYAKIDDVATIVGLNNYIELWNPELWNAEKVSVEEQVWQITESLEDRQ